MIYILNMIQTYITNKKYIFFKANFQNDYFIISHFKFDLWFFNFESCLINIVYYKPLDT